MDLQEDSLWIRMELMTRSVADVIALVEEGVMLGESIIAQVASDVRILRCVAPSCDVLTCSLLTRCSVRSTIYSRRESHIGTSAQTTSSSAGTASSSSRISRARCKSHGSTLLCLIKQVSSTGRHPRCASMSNLCLALSVL